MRSKFGLFDLGDSCRRSEYLKQNDMLDCLKMIHCHIGSQVYDIRNFKNASTSWPTSTPSCADGRGLDTIDIGGGLGVDYDGSSRRGTSSDQLHDREYAADVCTASRASATTPGPAPERIV
jgi:arginine decarboxylase